ncbi:MAG: hypothetical protein ACI3ZT_05325 [Candidatus Cryptobacteroides sp.]
MKRISVLLCLVLAVLPLAGKAGKRIRNTAEDLINEVARQAVVSGNFKMVLEDMREDGLYSDSAVKQLMDCFILVENNHITPKLLGMGNTAWYRRIRESNMEIIKTRQKRNGNTEYYIRVSDEWSVRTFDARWVLTLYSGSNRFDLIINELCKYRFTGCIQPL